MARLAHAPLFRGRHFPDDLIILAVRWYLRYSLSYRDLQELLAERGVAVDHTTIWRWVDHYGPELDQRLRPYLRPTGTNWRMDETYVRVCGEWTYLYRAVDSQGATVDFYLSGARDVRAAKLFLRKAMADAQRVDPEGDVFVPGCPPRPEQLIYALMMLQEKIQGHSGTVKQVLNLGRGCGTVHLTLVCNDY